MGLPNWVVICNNLWPVIGSVLFVISLIIAVIVIKDVFSEPDENSYFYED